MAQRRFYIARDYYGTGLKFDDVERAGVDWAVRDRKLEDADPHQPPLAVFAKRAHARVFASRRVEELLFQHDHGNEKERSNQGERMSETTEANWELIVNDRNESVRRLAVPTGWIYQTQDGRRFSTVSGTVGRDNDRGTPTWGPMVFVPK